MEHLPRKALRGQRVQADVPVPDELMPPVQQEMMAPPMQQMPTMQQAPQQVTLTNQAGSASDAHMRSTRRYTSTIMEVDRPTRTRTLDQLGPVDEDAQPHLYQRSDPPDTMGLICALELPHGDSLEIAVNLDAEERHQEDPM